MHNEDLLCFLPGETVMIKYDKSNNNYNKKMRLAPYLNKLYVGVLLAANFGLRFWESQEKLHSHMISG